MSVNPHVVVVSTIEGDSAILVLRHHLHGRIQSLVAIVSHLSHSLGSLLLLQGDGNGFHTEIHEHGNLVLVVVQLVFVELAFVYFEVLPVLFKHSLRRLLLERLEHHVYLARPSTEDLELPRVDYVVVLGAFLHELLEKQPSVPDHLLVLAIHELLLRNAGHVATRPPGTEHHIESIKLLVASLRLEFTLFICSCDGVSHSTTDFNRVNHGELGDARVFFIFDFVFLD